MLTALVREVSPSIERCELSYIARSSIDYGKALDQHRSYVKTLAAVGAKIEYLEGDNIFPDAVFVEDCAIVTDEIVVITRPGVASRRGEEIVVANALRGRRAMAHMEAPGTLDGGDVMRLGRTFFVGTSGRTNRAGFNQLGEQLSPFGYKVCPAEPRGCLHLKSACTVVGNRFLLFNPEWIDGGAFDDVEPVEVSRREPWAANTLTVGETIICSASYPETNERLRRKELPICEVDVSEFHKAEGALTCMSLLLHDLPPSAWPGSVIRSFPSR